MNFIKKTYKYYVESWWLSSILFICSILLLSVLLIFDNPDGFQKRFLPKYIELIQNISAGGCLITGGALFISAMRHFWNRNWKRAISQILVIIIFIVAALGVFMIWITLNLDENGELR